MSLWVFLIVITVILFVLFILTLIGYVTQRQKDVNGKHCVIIGGSQGIGLEVAKSCACRGAHVTIVARTIQKLKEAKLEIEKHRLNATQRIETRVLDISTSYDKVARALCDAEEKSGSIFLLVTCAGFTVCGRLEEIPLKDVRSMIDTNFLGTFFPIRYVLPKMKLARDGVIVLVGASLTGFVGIYGYSVLSSTKFALRGLAESLEMETRAFGITVTLAMPPATNTPGNAKELSSKPEESKLITGAGKLADAQKVGDKILIDALQGSFFSLVGFKSQGLACLCVGMSRWRGPVLTLIQLVVMGPLRFVGLIVQWHYHKLIKSIPNQSYC